MLRPLFLAHEVKKEEAMSFFETHFVETAFAISTLALALITPLSFLLSTTIGFLGSYYFEPNFKLGEKEPILTLENVVFTVVGGASSLLRFVPGVAQGALALKIVPIIASLAVGKTIYRFTRSL